MAATPLTLTPADLRRKAGHRRKETAIRLAFMCCGLVSIAISALIIVALVGKAISFLQLIDVGSLFARNWRPRSGEYSIAALFAGSFIVAGIAMAIAAPLGLGSAIYLSEYASPASGVGSNPLVELLAGIPSIVVGFFASDRHQSGRDPTTVEQSAPLFTLAAAGIGVGILTVPLVATISEDAMHAVPRGLREAAFGLGARRKATSLRIVVPAAVSGIVAAHDRGIVARPRRDDGGGDRRRWKRELHVHAEPAAFRTDR